MTQENTSKTLHIYTDGACRGNPGKGGWGALLKFGDHEKRIYGAEIHTTNNRMELLAVISALAELKHSCHIILTTDSKYVLQGMTEWLPKWRKNKWRNSGNKPVKNKDLWERLDHEIARHKIEWEWVRGHSGHVENTIADQLATSAIDLLLNAPKKKC